MYTEMQLQDITIEVWKKKVKTLRLHVCPPHGRVYVSAPQRMKLEVIQQFVLSKISWIRVQQQKVQERLQQRRLANNNDYYVLGKAYPLQIQEGTGPAHVELATDHLRLSLNPEAHARKQEVIDEWYRQLMKQTTLSLMTKWQPTIGVTVLRVLYRKMKSRWGSCNPHTKSITLNTELIKMPFHCLEYVVVHEMVHLLEASHNWRFQAFMDRFIPHWRSHRTELNRLGLAIDQPC